VTLPRALLFDTFGTVVDWHGSIAREWNALARAKGIKVTGARVASLWRAGYHPAMNRVRAGELGWTKLDGLHRLMLDDVLAQLGLTDALTEKEKCELNLAWHRLKPWPDAVPGLKRLKKKFVIAPLSNGNVALLVNLAKHGGLPWDCVFSAEIFRHYKPDPETYLGAAELLSLAPQEVMLVASHKSDLRAAARCGLQTCFVERPREFGSKPNPDLGAEAEFTLNVAGFGELASQLEA